eukprot:gnl/Spiro4/15390_TR8280_c0_g1_i1.p1 gnl/Spiro4/15390_TR8280_c0_g1~~gnl/Spiro4/15390_TR8280_c0_g1_i1.p1  ORF type:complete len:490 (-),score=32.50 gnl/Spiro4/15390_TR8280_c0_g1_i1:15-1430(-)
MLVLRSLFRHRLRRDYIKVLCLACVALVCVYIFVCRLQLYFQTGSWFIQPYEWYGPLLAGRRQYPTAKPVDFSPTCKRFSPSARSVQPECGPRTQTAARTVVQVSVQDKELFPWFWYSVLNAGKDAADLDVRVYESATLVPRRMLFEDDGLEFVMSSFPPSPVTDASLLVIVGDEHFDARSAFSQLPLNISIAVFLVGHEYCHNPILDTLAKDSRVRFGFITYGDCSFVDHVFWKVWPLGPCTRDGFPARLNPAATPKISERKFDINMMMTYTRGKPSRMQAWMSVQPFCEGLFPPLHCYTHAGIGFYMMKALKSVLGPQSGYSLAENAASSYHTVLRQSKLTLCPAGGSPEQYRIWEALMSGSIPVVEDQSHMWVPGTFVHPSHGDNFQCLPSDSLRLLKETNAPVLFVKDWRSDLPRLLERFDDSELQILQDRLATWYAQFLVDLKRTFFCQIHNTTKPVPKLIDSGVQ